MRASNPFDTFRQRNILALPGPRSPLTSEVPPQRFGMDTPPSQQQQPQRHQPVSFEDELMDLQNQTGPGLQAYKQYLTELPDRNNYAPGAMTRIAAALSGMSAGMRDPGEGIKVAQDVNSSNYKNAMVDYQNKGVGLKEQAGLEQDELDSKIRALQNARAMGLKYDEFKLKQLEAQAKADNDTSNAQSNRMRAEAYAKDKGKPHHTYKDQADGSILEINEDDGTQRVIPAKTVAAGQLGVAQQNAATARGQLGVAQMNAQTGVARESSYDYSVRNPRPTTTRPATPRVQQDAEDNALLQMSSDPLFKQYIQIDKAKGLPSVVPDDGSDDYQDFLAALDAKTGEFLSGRSHRVTRSK